MTQPPSSVNVNQPNDKLSCASSHAGLVGLVGVCLYSDLVCFRSLLSYLKLILLFLACFYSQSIVRYQSYRILLLLYRGSTENIDYSPR